ncbi:VWD domain-containing protein [Actinocorallia sp. A-T 12471]|uniref:VWD domain-containing protein n=1 Tax=Actinocorallia sp. A-T 12471 TaxID=3089813 RepID=UPI0029D37AEB|nr:VWD domain-containing protein [Actinocorallia sp. A-T 12471]MDX6740455.1 VWD domain-containing protein [Actinocorallia sp. A-T 12471]
MEAVMVGAANTIGLIYDFYDFVDYFKAAFSGRWAQIYVEPHLVTLDRLHYDMQSVGEFVLARSEEDELEIQARFTERRDNVSIIDRVAMYVEGHTVELGNNLIIDGQPIVLSHGESVQFGGLTGVLRSGDSYYVIWNGLEGGIFRWDGQCCHAGLAFPNYRPSDLVGLLGDYDGNPKNDLKLSDGTQLPSDADPATIHGDFADSWRITDATSLFTYPTGQGTADFTDLAFPEEIITVHDLSPEDFAAASTACEAQAVFAGPQFNACVLDVALTADISFAEQAAAQKGPTFDPVAMSVDQAGNLSLDFESTLSANVAPSCVSQDSLTTSYAGTFTGSETYRLYTPQLPAHEGGTVEFDLLTFGDWAADSNEETIKVTVDRGNPTAIDVSELTPVGGGMLQSGVSFAKYQVMVPFTHVGKQLEVLISSSGVTGLSGEGFGIDNLLLETPIVSPQVHQALLPFSSDDAAPGDGAGNLDNGAAVDEYVFELEETTAVYLGLTECSSLGFALNWRLLNDAGTAVDSGYCGNTILPNLAAGGYRLIIDSFHGLSGTYHLVLNEIPTTTAAVTLDGPAVSIETTAPGQQHTWTFTGTAGQRVFLNFSGGTFSSSPWATASLLDPSGNALASNRACSASCKIDATELPTTGTYRVVFDPDRAVVGSVALMATEVPTDAVQQLSIDGSTAELTTAAAGQNGRWLFSGAAGQKVSLVFTGGTFESLVHASVSLIAPDGTRIGRRVYCGQSCFFDPTTLPQTGMYTVEFDPETDTAGGLTAQVTTAGPVTAALTLGGPKVPLTISVPGQTAEWTFAGTAGQSVSIGFTDGTFGVGPAASVSVAAPDGTPLVSGRYCGTSCAISSLLLPATGTYSVIFDPYLHYTGSLTAKLDVGAVIQGTSIGGPATTVSITTAGQSGGWAFNGTTGQTVSFGLSGGTFVSAYNTKVSVVAPDETVRGTPLGGGHQHDAWRSGGREALECG